MYYSYCPEDGMKFHDTKEQAENRADLALQQIQHEAADSDWVWHDSGESISYGKVEGKVAYTDSPLTEEEAKENPDWSYIRSADLNLV